jgi:hypothetical protein
MNGIPEGRDARHALGRIERQRGRLADRLQPPLWYLAGEALAFLVLFLLPGVSQRPGHELPQGAMVVAIVAALVGLNLLDARLAAVTGVKLRSDRHRAYASSRAATLRAGTITLPAALVTWAVALAISWIASIAVGVVVALFVIRARQAVLAAIRDDIRAGRGEAR